LALKLGCFTSWLHHLITRRRAVLGHYQLRSTSSVEAQACALPTSMGCGSSSLKGEDQNDVQQQPIKKVQTNFSTVDYDATTQGRRDTTVGPLDTLRQKSEAPPPPTEKHENPPNAAVAPAFAQPETGSYNVDQIRPGDRIADQQPLVQDPVERNAEDPLSKEPYRDVTASPTTPIHNHASALLEQLPQQPHVTSAAADKQGEKPSY